MARKRFDDSTCSVARALNEVGDWWSLLTDKGRDLFPVVIALRQWGDKWNPAPDHQRLDLRDRRSGQPIRQIAVQDEKGNPLSVRDVFLQNDPEDDSRSSSA